MDQPYSQAAFKNKASTGRVLVGVLGGAISSSLEFVPKSKVRLDVVSSEAPAVRTAIPQSYVAPPVKRVVKEPLKPLQSLHALVSFEPRYALGTRKSLEYLRFMVIGTVATSDGPLDVMVESGTSRPFVVITHENQWVDAEFQLLKQEVFGSGLLSVPWPRVANRLMLRFVLATRQSPMSPMRWLLEQ